MLKEFDRNRDGKLDDAERAEAHKAMQARRAAAHQQMLTQFDSNRDGKLDDAEREKMMDQKMTEHFQQLDTNRDGMLSPAEFKVGVRDHHRRGGFGKVGHKGRRGPGAGRGAGRAGN
ncbi:MAG: EF-hand domain-containing protein [Myxococcales bacterium]|nr:EF-hand domain-containing protein [Myxococcales bacterium]